MKSEILWSEICAVHAEHKILRGAIQCSHYTDLWYQLKHTAASSKACGNNGEKDEPLSEVPWCLRGISLKCLLKPHPEDNTEMVRTFGHKRGAQSASSSPRIFRPASPTLRAWHKAKLGARFLLGPGPFMQTVMKRLTGWEKEGGTGTKVLQPTAGITQLGSLHSS